MVGVEKCVGNDLPGRVPGEIFLVNENPHQLRDGKRRVCL